MGHNRKAPLFLSYFEMSFRYHFSTKALEITSGPLFFRCIKDWACVRNEAVGRTHIFVDRLLRFHVTVFFWDKVRKLSQMIVWCYGNGFCTKQLVLHCAMVFFRTVCWPVLWTLAKAPLFGGSGRLLCWKSHMVRLQYSSMYPVLLLRPIVYPQKWLL